MTRRLLGPCVALATFMLAILLLEATCRLLGVDFEFKRRAFNEIPIFYRQPVVPVGLAFWRRPGPDLWKGKELDTMYQLNGGVDGRYAAERPVSIAYDADGFRNPEKLADWEIVVVGDSMTELGFLPYKDLFTTRLGRSLGLRVKNLGVSYTGTLTHTAYLLEFGRAASTRDAVLVFYEGNDR